MILLFTDFSAFGPYVGQVKLLLAQESPNTRVVDLMADAPAFNPKAAAYLLAALAERAPANAVHLAVVDPGVGGDRLPVMVEVDGRYFVGPDNGLFEICARRSSDACWWRIDWQPQELSASFHGRDLFAPVAARLAKGQKVQSTQMKCGNPLAADWPDQLAEIIYIDHFGNAVTGIQTQTLDDEVRVRIGEKEYPRKAVFSEVPLGEAFCYANSLGLLEVAVNRGRASDILDLEIGSKIELV